jgi:hypothetical protein
MDDIAGVETPAYRLNEFFRNLFSRSMKHLLLRLFDWVIVPEQTRARTPALQPVRRPALHSGHSIIMRSRYSIPKIILQDAPGAPSFFIPRTCVTRPLIAIGPR